jgi:hypothetical protein
MADDEEDTLMATGISEEEVVALATRTAAPGPLSSEEMAIIVDDKSTAEAIRGVLTARGGTTSVAGKDVPKRLIRLSLLQLGAAVTASAPAASTVSEAMSVLAIDAAASRRARDIQSFAQAGSRTGTGTHAELRFRGYPTATAHPIPTLHGRFTFPQTSS